MPSLITKDIPNQALILYTMIPSGDGLYRFAINFLTDNIVAIITIIITAIGVIGTPYYIRNRVNSAQQERYNQAKESLLDILENQVINDKDLSDDRLDNLLSAIERRYSVSISERVSHIEILQDLQLRIEESKLDVNDKEKYSTEIEARIKEIRDHRDGEDLPSVYRSAISELEGADNLSEDDLVRRIEKVRLERTPSPVINPVHFYKELFRGNLHQVPPFQRKETRLFMLVVMIAYLLFVVFVFFR